MKHTLVLRATHDCRHATRATGLPAPRRSRPRCARREALRSRTPSRTCVRRSPADIPMQRHAIDLATCRTRGARR